MLRLSNIVKEYRSGPHTVEALKGISIAFRPSEFVAILGPSGCGKTTLLNIIGGLDRYTKGDLIIRGRSTGSYKSRDWDTYRNHSVGFVFQSYNLIPHQSVLANVELALTLSGVKRSERRRRAKEALEKVGLGDQLHKRPNQLSGGQMQRVAIARALVNDPEILLADEPTGALDSDTSVQVMEILKEVAKDRLVIMVTHNPELAEQYATRTVRLLDGRLLSDTNPYDGSQPVAAESATRKGKRASMSVFTAFMLSLSNLMTKKGRTLMTAFAGSIGIVGIALILSISTGVNLYITDVERDTLSNYPLTLQQNTMDMSGMMSTMESQSTLPEYREDTIYSANIMSGMMEMMFASATTNNLTDFKAFIESGESGLEALTTEIRYSYSTPLNVYRGDSSGGVWRVNPSSVMEEMGMRGNSMMSQNIFTRLTGNDELLKAQYQVLEGRLPEKWNELILIVDEQNRISDYSLYALGLLDVEELRQAMQKKANGEDIRLNSEVHTFSFKDFLGMTFKLIPESDYYQETDGIWRNREEDELFMLDTLSKAETLTVVGVVKPDPDAVSGASIGMIGYRGELMEHLIDAVSNSSAVQAQEENPDVDILSGLPFPDPDAEPVVYTMAEIMAIVPTLPQDQQAQLTAAIGQMQAAGMSETQICTTISASLVPGSSSSTYEDNMNRFGVCDPDSPTQISLYPVDFESKDAIVNVIAEYNEGKDEESQIIYTDLVGLMMDSVTTIINAISYILIAFVGISLVVSSIMIGIITNISVLERTKEIGILRAVGASKKDISRVFNAETMIVGLCAGLVGIGLTELLIIPVNILIELIAEISAKAYLPPMAALILIGISIVLTAIAGLIPARNAANKDPVVALRTE